MTDRTDDPAPTLLSGGNPQIPKGDGDGPVEAYVAAMPGWKRDVGRRLDALVIEAVSGVKKAVRWNSHFHGTDEHAWFLSFHCFTLRPGRAQAHTPQAPPGAMPPHDPPPARTRLRAKDSFPRWCGAEGDSSAEACSPQPTPVPAACVAEGAAEGLRLRGTV